MLDEMTAGDVEMWRAWYEAQPRGEDRADLHTAHVVTEFVNMAVSLGGGTYVRLDKVLKDLRRPWTPDTIKPADREKRKRKRKEENRKRVKKKLASMRSGFEAMDAERKRKRGK